jgi:tetratricopeptide (TPR) repeat protein
VKKILPLVFMMIISIIVLTVDAQENAESLVIQGNDSFDLGNYSDAIVYYNKALEIEPGNFAAISSKGFAQYELENYNEAIDSFDKALLI